MSRAYFALIQPETRSFRNIIDLKMNTYYELGANVRNLLEHLRSNDENSISAISRHMKDIVRRMDDKTTYSPMQLSIVFSDILKISVGSAQELALQGIAVRQVRDIYGEYNLTLGDLCKE